MALVTMTYVICDVCGVPASDPEDNASRARRMVPSGWYRGRYRDWGVRDLCPKHAPEVTQ